MLCNKLIHCESARFQIFVTRRSTLLLSSLFGTLQYERERIFKSGPQHFQCEICKQIWSVRYIGLPSIFIKKNFLYRAMKTYFTHFAVRQFFANVFFFSFSFLNATMNFYRSHIFIKSFLSSI